MAVGCDDKMAAVRATIGCDESRSADGVTTDDDGDDVITAQLHGDEAVENAVDGDDLLTIDGIAADGVPVNVRGQAEGRTRVASE